jgi:hypothetical protein
MPLTHHWENVMEIKRRAYDKAWVVWKEIEGVWNIIYVTSEKSTATDIKEHGLRWPYVSFSRQKELAHLF